MFVKGQSGNPSGRPKMAPEVRDAIRNNGVMAVKRMAALLNDDGAWGDSTLSPSNLSTTLLAWSALSAASADDPGAAEANRRAEKWITQRVGSLTRKGKFGDHWWYLEGAQHLLKEQKDGAWGNEVDTCFALLFLRRASRELFATPAKESP